ncbi:hypothetical protein TYRP_005582 [Tyrophagus putrescentiae]|nr:hypothetical protein TYRP_005582 [Tyrophagus putrescentiae]
MAGRLFFKQLRALLRKHLIVRRFYYIVTSLELFAPVLIVGGLLLIFSIVNKSTDSTSSTSTNSTLGPLYYPNPYRTINFNVAHDFPTPFKLFYSPPDDTYQQLVKSFTSFANHTVTVRSFANETALDDAMKEEIQNHELDYRSLLGVFFENVDAQGKFNYSLKIPGSDLVKSILQNSFPTKSSTAEPATTLSSNYTFWTDFYHSISTVQTYLNHDYLQFVCTNLSITACPQPDLNRPLTLSRMPYPKYPNVVVSPLINLLSFILPIGYIFVGPLVVMKIAEERSNKTKELLKMVGLGDFVFWLAHFLDHFVVFFCHGLIFTIILWAAKVFTFASPVLFIIQFTLFSVQLVLFIFLMVTIFSKPQVAINLAYLVFSGLLTADILLMPSYQAGINVAATNPVRILLTFFPPGSLIWFLSLMGGLEATGQGLGFSTINEHTQVYLDFTATTVMLSTLASCFIYAFLIFYIDAVTPFQHGVPKKPLFLFTPSYWFPKSSSVSYETLEGESQNPYTDPAAYEVDPKSLNATIRIENLTKTFKKKNAVDNLWLNIYENQITVLLGHNGAGKTTTMNMITGLFPSTSGNITIDGYNVFTNTRESRKSLAICSQDNAHFKELTVEQHLNLFALLKDFPEEELKAEVEELLELLKLSEKKDTLSTKLSGGMKRRLSLGIALCGKTSKIILDEPTSGMDPDTRRVLGDRIAIMNEGKLSCVGSPLFLKKAFGAGYRLRIAKVDQGSFDSSTFQRLLFKYIPSVTLSTEIETEVIYNLETECKANTKQFMATLTKLFEEIEVNKDALGIEAFGLSFATLEDVFIAVGSDLDIKSKSQGQINGFVEHSTLNGQMLLTQKTDLISGLPLWKNQVVGLFLKRFNYAKRYWKSIFLQLIVPTTVMIVVSVLQSILRNINASSSKEKISLNLNLTQLYGVGTQTFYYGVEEYLNPYETVNQKFLANVSQIPGDNLNSSSVAAWIIDSLGPDSLQTYNRKHLYGLGTAENHSQQFNLWFSFEQYHSLPLSINVLYESLLQSILPKSNSTSTIINTQAKPVLTLRQAESGNLAMMIVSWSVTCFSILPNAFLYLGAAFILQPIRENASKVKLLQLMTGLNPITYWTVSYLFDLLVHLAIVLILFIITALFDRDRIFFGNAASASLLFGLLFGYGVAVIPFAYLLSYRFEKTSRGLQVIMQVFTYLGTLASAVFGGLDLWINYFNAPYPALNVIFHILVSIFRVVPIFSALFGYQKYYKLQEFSGFCLQLQKEGKLEPLCATIPANLTGYPFKGCCANVCGDACFLEQTPWSFNRYGSGIEVAFMVVTGLIWISIIFAYELKKQQFSRVFERINLGQLFNRKKKKSSSKKQLSRSQSQRSTSALITEDADVLKEKARIDHSHENTDLMTVRKLTKRFDDLTAVDSMSFGVHYQECFGLLGVNGAGKSTTFRMLCGDLLPSSGNAYLHQGRFSLLDNLRSYEQNIGYCSQESALLGKMTGEEMLYLFARLRGIPDAVMKRDIDNLIRMTGMEDQADKLIESLSGGNRRKLHLALSMVGSPSICFLDEPTSGVDPVARRKIWQALGYMKRLNSSIVLTSHSMEECEALCSRIGIMVNGRFCCMGSPQHLRSKYGQGYTVTISLQKTLETDSAYVDSVQTTVRQRLPSAVLKDHHQSLMLYHVTDQSQRWSAIFAAMASLNEQFDFEDYYVSDTTLENVFIMFARHQVKEEDLEEKEDDKED